MMSHNRTISNIRQAPFIHGDCSILTSFSDGEAEIGVSINDKQGFSDRLNAVIDAAGIAAKGKGRQNEIAKLFKVSQKGARKWLEGEAIPRYETLKKITERFKNTGVTVEWLLSGDPSLAPPLLSADGKRTYSPEDMKTQAWRVPVIRWTEAGATHQHTETPHMPDEWANTCTKPRANTFALRVKGDAMEPTFPEGALIIVEPDLDPRPDDYVIVGDGEGEAVFKQLIADGPDLYLKPINPRYPIKPLGDQKIIGVVRELVSKFR